MTHAPGLNANLRKNLYENECLLQTVDMVMCPGQLLASKIHNRFNLRNNIIKKIGVPLISIFLDKVNLHCLILLKVWHGIS